MDHPPKTERRRYGLAVRSSALIAAAATALACSATTDEHASSRTQPIAGGTADSSHQNVFMLERATQNGVALCTATLIAPNLLLTARHCVSPGTGDDHVLCGDALLGEPFPASAFIATNDANPNNGSEVYRAIAVRVPGLGEDTCGYDLALIILKHSVPEAISTPAVPRIDREVEPGESYTAVGYGENEVGNQTRGRMQLVGLSVGCEPGSCGEGVESTEFLGETGVCPGDSGGPALDASGKVVGVVSRGGPECSTPIYSTVTAWHDFIVDTAKEAAELGGYEAPFWVTTGLSDPPVLVGQDGAGGAGGASSSEAEGMSEGKACDAASDCQSGLVCYVPGNVKTGTCAAICQATSECSAGLTCQDAGTVSVCTEPRGNADDKGGCSVTATRPQSPLSGLLLVALGAALGLARRRRFLAR